MEVMFLRHGEPDYAHVADLVPKYRGHRYDLIHLSAKGEAQVNAAVAEARAFDADVIVSSPYPRCLQSAAILSRALDLDLHVHPDLHEWLPVGDGTAPVSAEIVAAAEEAYWRNRTAPSPLIGTSWESDADIVARIGPVLDEYSGRCQRVLVVTHEVVIRAMTGRLHTAFGEDARLAW
jgi:broad specificity phosphatase PhoE